MTISPRTPLLRVALLAGAVLACAAPSAHAVHWPGFGGDPGRSGNQPVDAGTVPLTGAIWHADGAVRTSVITSGGAADSQRAMYGTADGVVHLRRLGDGTVIGGADIGGEANVFGTQSPTPGADGSVSFADTSTDDALGQLFAVHNETGGIQIAHFDEVDGSLRQQFDVPGTAGMTVESSLLATPAEADGSRALLFVAGGRLFRVEVADAQRRTASFGAVDSTLDVNATPIASPTLVYLDLLGTPTAHVAIGTSDGDLRTYRAADLTPGPLTPLPPARDVLTAVVPVQPDGRTPSPGSPLETPPEFYVSTTSDVQINGADSTGLFKLRQDPANEQGPLEELYMTLFPGQASPAMAVAQSAEQTGVGQSGEPVIEDGKLVLGLDFNIFLVSTRDFDVVGSFDTNFSLVGGDTGFQQTTGAVAGDYVYVTNDRGEQWVVRVSDGKPVETDEFERDPANTGTVGEAVGQPAVSRGYVAFGGPDGVFVYRNSDLTPPAVQLTAPAADATVSGTVTVAATASDARGISQVEFRANGRSLGTDTTADGESFSVSVDTNGMPAGEYVLDAIATDGSDLTTLSGPRRVVVRSRGEDTPPTVEFTRPAAGALLSGRPTLSANASDDHGVASVRFLAGERLVCTDTTAPYECDYRLGADDVGRTTLVAVATDTAGQTGAALRTVRVSRFTPASVSASTAPRRDRRRPFRFTTSGRVRLPSGLTRAQACGSGDVAVVVKAARKTISTRRVQLSRTCTYRSRVTFRSRNRFPRNGRLTVRVRFLGNAVLGPRRAGAVAVRTR